MNCGVYRIQIGPHFYYGSSHNLSTRRRTHERDLLLGRHGNTWMQRAWDRYHDFSFEVVEECEPSERLHVEQSYLSLHYTNPLCMNLAGCAGASYITSTLPPHFTPSNGA